MLLSSNYCARATTLPLSPPPPPPPLPPKKCRNPKKRGLRTLCAKLMLAARPPLAASFWGGRVMMALLAVGTLAVSVPGEQCTFIPASGTCTAMLEYVLVVDNSWSMREHYNGISDFMRRVTGSFALDTQDEFAPRVSIITIAGGFQDDQGEHAQVLHPLSGNAATLTTAINGRPAPSREKGYTCISCGLDLAASILSLMKGFRKSGGPAKQIVMVLTDGEQTVWGGNDAAMRAADALKKAGADIVAISLGACPCVALRVPRQPEGP